MVACELIHLRALVRPGHVPRSTGEEGHGLADRGVREGAVNITVNQEGSDRLFAGWTRSSLASRRPLKDARDCTSEALIQQCPCPGEPLTQRSHSCNPANRQSSMRTQLPTLGPEKETTCSKPQRFLLDT